MPGVPRTPKRTQVTMRGEPARSAFFRNLSTDPIVSAAPAEFTKNVLSNGNSFIYDYTVPGNGVPGIWPIAAQMTDVVGNATLLQIESPGFTIIAITAIGIIATDKSADEV